MNNLNARASQHLRISLVEREIGVMSGLNGDVMDCWSKLEIFGEGLGVGKGGFVFGGEGLVAFGLAVFHGVVLRLIRAIELHKMKLERIIEK